MQQSQLNQDVQILRQRISALPEAVVRPAFIVVSGLPGTGKSFFCGKLAEKSSFLIVESDAMRKVLCSAPIYSAEESARLFVALHSLIEELLQKGIPVIFDATNLVEQHREHLYHVGDKTEQRVLLRSLLRHRQNWFTSDLRKGRTAVTRVINLTLTGEFIEKMKPTAGKIQRNHFVVDT